MTVGLPMTVGPAATVVPRRQRSRGDAGPARAAGLSVTRVLR
ncbi:hypothetical protein SGM_3385 [Streptomyces griseoaurantiacus M045]|uniref:Uncharacterized protein n=1 Tax=Streptomyces griseoaurantiacus M045 TaxID=996637 RepID=F3NJS1_9ACTN|nr:hypothetical protein SGM_3385 [Streptomyces griseoaurantiacus M045]